MDKTSHGILVALFCCFARISGNARVIYWTVESGGEHKLFQFYGDPSDWVPDLDHVDVWHEPFDAIKAGEVVADYHMYGHMFVHDKATGAIVQLHEEVLHGPIVEVYSYGGSSVQVHDLALDWVSQNIYYTDRQMVALWSYKNRRAQVVLDGLDSPHGVDVDPQRGFLFWTEQTSGRIRRSSLSGSDPRTLHRNLTAPQVLCADPASQRLYWTSHANNVVHTSDYNGKDTKELTAGRNKVFLALDTYLNYLFLPTNEGNRFDVYFHDGTYATSIGVGLELTQYDVFMASPETQPQVESPCSTNNGGCEHICVHDPAEHLCLCQFGYHLDLADRRSCRTSFTVDEDSLIVVDKGAKKLFQMNLQSGEVHDLAVTSAGVPRAVTFDPINAIVYWTSSVGSQSYIMAKNMRTDAEQIFKTLKVGSSGDALAMDPVGRRLYMADGGLRQIQVFSLTGAPDSVLAALSGTTYGLAIDVANSDLYWASHDSSSSVIQKTDLKSGQTTEVVAAGSTVSGLALDHTGSSLYWCDDTLSGYLKYSSLSGSELQTMATGVKCTGVTVDETYVYAASKHGIVRIHKVSKTLEFLEKRFYWDLFGMVRSQSTRSPSVPSKGTTESEPTVLTKTRGPVHDPTLVPKIAGSSDNTVQDASTLVIAVSAAAVGLVVVIVATVIIVVIVRRRGARPNGPRSPSPTSPIFVNDTYMMTSADDPRYVINGTKPPYGPPYNAPYQRTSGVYDEIDDVTNGGYLTPMDVASPNYTGLVPRLAVEGEENQGFTPEPTTYSKWASESPNGLV